MGDPKPPAVAFDSCIVIDLFDERARNRPDIRQIITDAETGKLVIVISTFVHAEVGASSKNVTSWQLLELRRALSQSYFEPVEASVPLALLACDLARENKLKPADAIHAATCVTKKVKWLITTDDGMLRAHQKILLDASDRSQVLNIVTPEQFCDEFFRPLFPAKH